MQPIIVQGDKTSHGGSVLTGSPFSDCDGKPIARVGDMVSCPRCKGVFPIAQGDQSNIIDGAPVAYHGRKTACGATLISSQMRTLTEPSGGTASSACSSTLERFGAVGAGMGLIRGPSAWRWRQALSRALSIGERGRWEAYLGRDGSRALDRRTIHHRDHRRGRIYRVG